MKLNIVLLTVAAALIALVTYRMGLIQLNRRFCLDLLPNLALAVVLMVALYFWAGGMHGVKLGALAGVKVTLKFVPLLVVVFWAVGEASLLIEMHKEWVREALGGKYGLIGAFLAAMVMPSGMTGLPIVADLWDKGGGQESADHIHRGVIADRHADRALPSADTRLGDHGGVPCVRIHPVSCLHPRRWPLASQGVRCKKNGSWLLPEPFFAF